MHDIIRNAEYDRRQDNGKDSDLCPAPAAQSSAERMTPADDDVPENGDTDGQPDSDSVRRDAQVCIEDEVDDPTASMSVRRRRDGVAIEVTGVRYVGRHR